MHDRNELNVNGFSDKRSIVIFIVYVIMLLYVSFVVIYLAITTNLPSCTDNWLSNSITEAVFYTADGEHISDMMSLYELNDESLYTVIPENLAENMALCFRTKHVYLTVYIGGEQVYEMPYEDSRFYTDSTGANWVKIPITTEQAGKKLRIDFKLAYDSPNCGLSDVIYCSPDGFVLKAISERLPSLAICFIYVVVGFIFIVLGIITSRLIKNDFSLFWLGALALSVASYCFFETQVLQIFITNTRLIHLCVMFSMAMIPIPAIAYSSTFLEFKFKDLAFAVMLISFVSFVILTVLNFADISDYHTNILVMQLMLVIAMLILGVGIVSYIVRYLKSQKEMTVYVVAMIIGLLCIIFTGFVDIVRYWNHSSENAAKYLRIGFFGFLICFSVASCERIVHAFHSSMHAKMISKLAYEDGLTGLKNRTSYQEAVMEIEAKGIPTGVVMMDVNNLKQVNDTYGHDDGDNLITTTADFIRDAFESSHVTCYRIGGDEFVALIQDADNSSAAIKSVCDTHMKKLKQLYSDYNAQRVVDYDVVIAVGYDIYDPIFGISFKDVADKADSRMYENKRYLKSISV